MNGFFWVFVLSELMVFVNQRSHKRRSFQDNRQSVIGGIKKFISCKLIPLVGFVSAGNKYYILVWLRF